VLVARDRIRLGYRSLPAFAAISGLGRTTLDSLEHGRKASYEPATLSRLEHALGWQHGSIQRVLDGGAPQYLEDPDLTIVMANWRHLPAEVRRGIRALVEEVRA
jgi:hypothetical protein